MSAIATTTDSSLPKAIGWDFDGTITDRTWGEGHDSGAVQPNPVAVHAIHAFGRLGVQQFVVTRNPDRVGILDFLRAAGLLQHFDVTGSSFLASASAPKSPAILNYARLRNIGVDTVLYVDNDELELREVETRALGVRTVHIDALSARLRDGDLDEHAVTQEARLRSQLIAADDERKRLAAEFLRRGHTPGEFIASLHPILTVRPATEDDVLRVSELIDRCNQYKTTAQPVTRDDLKAAVASSEIPDWEVRAGQCVPLLLIATIQDDVAPRERGGFVLIDRYAQQWRLRTMAVSCRIANRGIGEMMLTIVAEAAKAARVELIAEFVPTERNAPMRALYADAGFVESQVLLSHDFEQTRPLPPWVQVEIQRESQSEVKR